jgi:ATP-dependent DNA ligase
MLKMIFAAAKRPDCVQLAESTPVRSWKEAEALYTSIRKEDGEGIMLKDRSSKYEVGLRTKTWLKHKDVMSAVLRCVGYKAGKLGPHSVLRLKDTDGNTTSVKVRNLKWLAEVNKNPKRNIGRMVRIEFQERTPGGGYRGPVRMDRWEDQ